MSGLFGSKTTTLNNTENKLSALSIQTSTQGIPVPIVYGCTRISVNNMWYGDFTAIPHTSSTTTGGGKAGSMTTVTTTYTYTTGLMMGLCEGPIAGLGRVWSNKDITDDLNLGFTLFNGSYSQAAWSYMTTYHPESALNYRGTAYVANGALDLAASNYLPNLTFEVNGLLYTGQGASVAYASFDPAQKNSRLVLSGNNLTVSRAADGVLDSTNAWSLVKGNIYKSTGKWQAEFELLTYNTPSYPDYHVIFGLVASTVPVVNGAYPGVDGNSAGYFGTNYPSGTGFFSGNGCFSDQGGAMARTYAGDIVTVLYNADDQELIFKVNGVQQGATILLVNLIGGRTSFTFGAALWSYLVAFSIRVNTGGSAFAYPEAGYSGWSGISTQFDVTPAAVITDLLPNVYYGAGFTALDTLTDFDAYCNAAGFLCSPAYTAQNSAASIVLDLTQLSNAAPVWSEGVLKVIPYADVAIGSYTPNTTIEYNLTDDDFIASEGDDPVKSYRKRQADAFNVVSIECLDRNNAYNVSVVEVKDQANIDQYGLRPMPIITMHQITIPEIAGLVAQTILKRVLYFRNMYEFTVGWPYSRLEPMDLVSLTDAGLGMNQEAVRLLSITEDDNGHLKMQAEDFIVGVSNPVSYGVQSGVGFGGNVNSMPGNSSAPFVFQPPLSISSTPQIWIGVAAQNISNAFSPDWGGCEVWFSPNNVTYTKVGQVTAPSTYGVLSQTLAAGADPDVTNTLSVDLTETKGSLASVSQAQADALLSLCYVDGELLSYATASLASLYNYNLTYLRRGQEWTSSIAHSVASPFMLLNGSVVAIDCPYNLVGTTVYIKCPSYNTAGTNLQSLADVDATTYDVTNIGLVVQNGIVPDVVQWYEDLYVPANTTFTVAGAMINHGKITVKGRLRITN